MALTCFSNFLTSVSSSTTDLNQTFGFLNSSDLILKLVNVKCPLGI